MAAIKIHCPKCQASIRQNADAADAAGRVSATCPRCGAHFSAKAESADPPPEPRKASPTAQKPATKPAKALAHGDDDDDKPKKARRPKRIIVEEDDDDEFDYGFSNDE